MKERKPKRISKKEGEPEGPNYMTYETYLRLQQEKEAAQQRAGELQRSMMGTQDNMQDWHDNFAYEQLQRDLENADIIAGNIVKALENPVLVAPRTDINSVQVGNQVTIQFDGEDEKETYTLLGPSDGATNPLWISYRAPLGQALVGATKGENRIMTTPDKRKIGIKVKDIQPGQFTPPPQNFTP